MTAEERFRKLARAIVVEGSVNIVNGDDGSAIAYSRDGEPLAFFPSQSWLDEMTGKVTASEPKRMGFLA